MENNENRVEKAREQWHVPDAKPDTQKAAKSKRLERLEKALKQVMSMLHLTPAEQRSKEKLKQEIRKQQKQLRPGILERFFSAMPGAPFRFLAAFLKAWREYRESAINHILSRAFSPPGEEEDKKQRGQQESGQGKPMDDAPFKAKQKEIRDHIVQSMKDTGLGTDLPKEATLAMNLRQPAFEIERSFQFEDKRMSVKARYEKAANSGRYYIARMTAQKIPGPDFLDGVADAKKYKRLDERMAKFDWNVDYRQNGIPLSADKQENDRQWRQAQGIIRDLYKLNGTGPEANQEVHDRLVYKHFLGTASEKRVANMAVLKEKYGRGFSLDLNDPSSSQVTVRQAHNLLEGRAVKANEGTDEGHWKKMDALSRRKDGFSPLATVDSQDKFNTYAQMAKMGIMEHATVTQAEQFRQRFEEGSLVKAFVRENGVVAERVVYANPEEKKIAVDWKASEAEGVYTPANSKARDRVREYFDSLEAGKEKQTGRVASMAAGKDGDTDQKQGRGKSR